MSPELVLIGVGVVVAFILENYAVYQWGRKDQRHEWSGYYETDQR